MDIPLPPGSTVIPRSIAEALPADWDDPELFADHLATLIQWASVAPAACREWMEGQSTALQARLAPEIAGSLMPGGSFAVKMINQLATAPAQNKLPRS